MDLSIIILLIAFHIVNGIPTQPNSDALSKATTKFAIDILKANGKSDKNAFFSPTSISTCVGMVYAGSSGQTKSQINKAIYNGMNDQTIYDLMTNLSGTLNSPSTSYNLSIANRVYVQQKFEILPTYISKLQTHFYSEIKTVDFVSAAESVRQGINTWVEQKTNSKIKNLIPQGALDSAIMVLVNAIYFKGNWSHQFKESDTDKKTFYSSLNKNGQIDMMKQFNQKFYYNENDDAQVLGLTYITDQLALYILLPKKRFGLSQVEQKLSSDYFLDLIKYSSETTVAEVQIPKFKLEEQYELKDIFVALGMKDMFSNSADFSGIDGKRDLFASAIIHKAFIEVNEKGSEAAAATAIIIERMSAIVEKTEPPKFIADHPFLFAIVDRRIWNPLFFGRFVGN